MWGRSVHAKRLPRVVLEDSVLHVTRKIAHLASIHLLLLPLPKFLADPQELDLLPGETEKNRSLSLRKSRICFLCELSNLYLHIIIVRPTLPCQNTEKILPRNRFISTSSSKKFSLLMQQSTSSHFAHNIQSFSCSLRRRVFVFVGLCDESDVVLPAK